VTIGSGLSGQHRVAALPMYDLPELRAANDALWCPLADRLAASGIGDVPAALTRDRPLNQLWRDRRLLLAQSCGYPLVTSLRGLVQVVATPRYRAPGCDGAFYRSAIVVAAGNPVNTLADLRNGCCAVNELSSNSGMNLLRAAVAPLATSGRFFRCLLWSGSHRSSLALVADGDADVAAIDCVTFELLRRTNPALVARVRILDWTDTSPGLPLLTAAATDERTLAGLRAALDEIARDPAVAPARDALLIDGFEILDPLTYDRVLNLKQRAGALGYPKLA